MYTLNLGRTKLILLPKPSNAANIQRTQHYAQHKAKALNLP